MKQYFLIIAGLAISSQTFSQNNTIDQSNTREGESVEYCTTHKKLEQLLQDPDLAFKYQKGQQIMQQQETLLKQNQEKAGTVYKIPIVFHLLHNGGTEKISDEQILDGLRVLNRDFRRLNADANNVVSAFQGMPADIEIEFVLATIAPNGQCFSGITHTQSPVTNDTQNDSYDGQDQVNAIINGNDVYQGNWNPSNYLNVIICKSIGGAGGYTFNPMWGTGNNMYYNSVFVLSNYIGEIGTSSPFTARTLTHEVGHWLNLSHTWGGNNSPGDTDACNYDDGVDDTPNCIGLTTCNLNANTCTGIDPFYGFDQIDNAENYMDYSYCSKMFTPGQKTRMRAAITSSVAGRNNVWTSSNLQAVGATGNPPLCQAKFDADNRIICNGQTVQFDDQSFHNPTSWSWTFVGGSPATSTQQNPSVTYNTAGNYPVTLTVSNASGTVSNTIQDFITVLPETGIAPIHESFEFETIFPSNNWFLEASPIGANWELKDGVGYSGTKCAKVNAYSEAPSTTVLESTSITLDLNLSASLSFKYAYTTKGSNAGDKLIVKVSKNCGQTWVTKKVLQGTTLQTAPPTSSEFEPTLSEWKTATINSSSLASYLTSDFRIKFIFENKGGGNNLYIDDINIDGVVTVEENKFLNDLSLYPNPTTNNASLSFYLNQQEEISIDIVDLVGKKVLSIFNGTLPSGQQFFSLPTNTLSKGIYFVRINNNKNGITQKLIIE